MVVHGLDHFGYTEGQLMTERVAISTLMQESGVGFGTSGARGLVSSMTDRLCVAYTLAFLQQQKQSGQLGQGTPVAIAGDLRPSTPRILGAVASGIRQAGHPVDFAGYVPSPAVALYGLQNGYATVMVTGSHIPADRNGMKFTTPRGEITKADEAGIREQVVEPWGPFGPSGELEQAVSLGAANPAAEKRYLARYLEAFPPGCLRGLTVGVYGHSAVGARLLVRLYEELGATVVPLGFSSTFVPVDTEAIRPEDLKLARGWAREQRLDAIVSTDGDSDRPLVFDEMGSFVRGDLAGILTARYLGADGVATPISCNGALELSGRFPHVLRTKIGSPFVIEGMQALAANGAERIVGYEANGGFLQQSLLTVPGGKPLLPLPTRDAVIVHLALLLDARARGVSLSTLVGALPRRFTASGRDQSFQTEASTMLLDRLANLPPAGLALLFDLGPVVATSDLDGFRITFESSEVLHLRPSGNAPELRCYAEAGDEKRAQELVEHGLQRARALA